MTYKHSLEGVWTPKAQHNWQTFLCCEISGLQRLYRSLLKVLTFSFRPCDVLQELWDLWNQTSVQTLIFVYQTYLIITSAVCWIAKGTDLILCEAFCTFSFRSMALNLGLIVCALANFCIHLYRNNCMYFSYMKQTMIQAHNYFFWKMENLVYIHTIAVVPEGHNEAGSSLFLLQLTLIVSFFPEG